MRTRTQQICAWTGPAMIVVMLVAFLIAGFIPPPSPHDTADQIAHIFRSHPTRIRFGLVLTMFGAALLGPFVAVITVQMKRIEGRHSPLAYLQLALGALLVIEFIIPVMVLQAAAFRPELAATTIRTLDDLGWLLFVGAPSTAVVQAIIIGVAILQDQREKPVLPRWGGYLSIWAGLLFAPGGIIVFFKHGAFGWNGLATWWLGLSAFGIWLVAMTVLLLGAIRQQAEMGAAALPDGATGLRGSADDRIARLEAEVAALRAELRRISA
jgi:hypothetical protein